MELEALPSLAKLSKEKRHEIYAQYESKGQFFAVEYSKSDRALCRGCRKKIASDVVRARHLVCNNRCCKKDKKDVCGRWHMPCLMEHQKAHVEMFVHSNPAFLPISKSSQLAGFSKLEQKDKDDIAALF